MPLETPENLAIRLGQSEPPQGATISLAGEIPAALLDEIKRREMLGGSR